MEHAREHIYLAALLHDIGKFYQRADIGSVSASKVLSQQNKIESTFLPQYKGRYSHKHCLWTAQFIDDNQKVFQSLVGADITDLSDKNSLLNLAACHHLQKDQLSELGQMIKEADCLSSGMDRDSEDALRDDQDENSWDAFKKKRMTSILQRIGNNVPADNSWWHLPVEKMSLNKSHFPQPSFDANPDYFNLWSDFVAEFKFVQANTYRAFSETFLNLMFKYTSCIPASTVHFPDVSLYDHSKTTAALAVCLYDYKLSGDTAENPFLLIGADFSGIQPYIYQIVSKYASKNLKGRSFYLELLSDAVVRYLLNKLNLFQANIIYNSGGGFYLIAPNTNKVKEQLEEATREIEKSFFDVYGTSLFVAIDSIEISKNALLHKNKENLGTVWGELFKKRDKKKNSKFSSIIQSDYHAFFSPILQGGNAKRDVITGEEFISNEIPVREKDLLIKKATADQIKLGAVLKETDLMVVSEGEIPYWKDRFFISPANLGFTYYFINSDELVKMKESLKSSADKVSVITLNGKNGECDFLHNPSFARLGVLRMDVDNLGLVFQKGINPERATLSRYAALSRSFDYFFSGYLNTIWKEVNPEKSFIIYSGGDDVFIVGSWDVCIKLAKKIREDFRLFTCKNSAFSLSGGIAIVPANYPIMKGADESHVEEKNAKNHQCGDVEKNAISFMDMALNWDNEFPVVELLKNRIVDFSRKEVLPKSFISKLMSHWANAKIENHQIKKINTFWLLTYDMSRMKERIKDSEVRQMIDSCTMEICEKRKSLNGNLINTDYHPIELWAFAARWAELELRSI